MQKLVKKLDTLILKLTSSKVDIKLKIINKLHRVINENDIEIAFYR